MRQPAEDRARYYRQLRETVAGTFLPELTSATAIDAAALVDRILAEFIVEEECGDTLSQEFGAEFATLLGTTRWTWARSRRPSFTSCAHKPLRSLQLRPRVTMRHPRSLCRQLVDVEHRFLERVDELRRGVLAEDIDANRKTSAAECSVTPAQLTAYLGPGWWTHPKWK